MCGFWPTERRAPQPVVQIINSVLDGHGIGKRKQWSECLPRFVTDDAIHTKPVSALEVADSLAGPSSEIAVDGDVVACLVQ